MEQVTKSDIAEIQALMAEAHWKLGTFYPIAQDQTGFILFKVIEQIRDIRIMLNQAANELHQ